ncbi:MAG: hypothetical protein LC637_02300 [Xanthomonadaceae bacterium]|nr:hypothetical protein [Xanthomonadaceae bacterium]
MTPPNDINHDTRVRCYERLLNASPNFPEK